MEQGEVDNGDYDEAHGRWAYTHKCAGGEWVGSHKPTSFTLEQPGRFG